MSGILDDKMNNRDDSYDALKKKYNIGSMVVFYSLNAEVEKIRRSMNKEEYDVEEPTPFLRIVRDED